MNHTELADVVRRIWQDDMPDEDRVALKQRIGQRLGLSHPHVVGAIDFNEEAATPQDVATNLLALVQQGVAYETPDEGFGIVEGGGLPRAPGD